MAVCSLALKMLTTIKMLVRFQMNFNLSCNPDFAQTLTVKSWHSGVSALSVSHTPQVAAMSTAERSAAVFGLTAAVKQFNVLR